MAAEKKGIDSFKDRLEDRKSKVTNLVKGIKKHEHEVEEAARTHTPLKDPKYSGANKTSVAFSEEDETGSGTKKRKESAGVAAASRTVKKVSTIQKLRLDKPTTAKRKSPQAHGKLVKPAAAEEKKRAKHKDIILSVLTDRELNEHEEEDKAEVDSNDAEEGFLHIVEALHCFANTQYIFMHRLLDLVEKKSADSTASTATVESAESTKIKDTKNKGLSFQILNYEGELLFLMQQSKLRGTGFILYSKKIFENILYDIYGNKVLKFIGPSVFLSRMTSKMTVTDAQNRMLGYIKAFGTRVNYSVYNAIGERLFLVVSDLRLPSPKASFTILCRGQKIGVIKTGWKQTFEDLTHIENETVGIEFPAEMDEREKALLLGCLMLIEFFWFSPLTRLKLSILLFGICLFLLAIIVLCVPLIVDRPPSDATTKSFYIVEKPEKPKKSDGKEVEAGIG